MIVRWGTNILKDMNFDRFGNEQVITKFVPRNPYIQLCHVLGKRYLIKGVAR